jgi:hypothetical protein
MIKRSLSDDYHVMTNLYASKDVAEALAWCKLNVVEYDKNAYNLYDKRGWTYERFNNCTNFVFIREQDAFMFSLRFA